MNSLTYNCVVRINPRKINGLDAAKAFTANSS